MSAPPIVPELYSIWAIDEPSITLMESDWKYSVRAAFDWERRIRKSHERVIMTNPIAGIHNWLYTIRFL